MSSSKCGRNLSFPASVKTEDSEYLLFHFTKEKLQDGLMCSDYLSPFFGCPLRVLAPRCFSWFPGFRGVEQNPRIPRLQVSEFVSATACVSFVLCFLPIRCTAHCHQQRVRAKLANRASHLSCNSFFFRGVMTPYVITRVRF